MPTPFQGGCWTEGPLCWSEGLLGMGGQSAVSGGGLDSVLAAGMTTPGRLTAHEDGFAPHPALRPSTVVTCSWVGWLGL